MTTLSDLNGYLDDEAYTIRVGELRALLSASIADTAGAKIVPLEPTEEMMRAVRHLDWTSKTDVDWDEGYRAMIAAAPAIAPAPSVADAQKCAQTVLDLRDMLLRLIKHEGMANDEATNKMYQKTTDALFAASRIKEGAPSVADAAGASEDAQDAARWRHLRNCGVIVDFTHAGPWKFTDDVDAAVDKLIARSAAIKAASASKTTERKKLCTGSHIMCEGREYCLGHPSCSELAAKESGND